MARVTVVCAVLMGCSASAPEAASESSGAGSSGTGGFARTSFDTNLGPRPTSDSGGFTTGTDTAPLDLGPGFGCNPLEQDCGSGFKCAFYSGDGTPFPNGTRCVPVANEPSAVGQPCRSEGFHSGADDCDAATACWFVDADLVGTCVSFCSGPLHQPGCDDPDRVCAIDHGVAFTLCLEQCSPLEGDCTVGQLCVPVNEHFVCNVDADPRGSRDVGDPCTWSNQCDAGLWCGVSQLNSLCDAAAGHCCHRFCDVADPKACDESDTACFPWYDVPPANGLHNLGACLEP